MNAPQSPYSGPPARWRKVTQRLVSKHPLSLEEVREVALVAWRRLWETRIGSGRESVLLAELRVPATVVGYFFEVLFARELAARHSGKWRGNQSGDEKDLVYLPDPRFSIEIKSSGQLGFRVYGNRSVGQTLQRLDLAKKEKSGYYLLVNFFAQALTLLRFGWIDESDWKPQRAPTGQMAGLSEDVYRYKLVTIRGDYELDGPVQLLTRVGKQVALRFAERGVTTIRQLIAAEEALPMPLRRIREEALQRYSALL